ncbi:dickkopf-related protein 3b isoform X2 [Entelurus aequoreus]|uniref:dickkopf-related protein 3b isoform X2 n=1 Tax=Entelurus aequoreus TaxID=161455 RepID=UPI002B1E562D|nr:dickkopf-related protein 3b isoform X2 [Entelurus aequoreus]
MSLRIPLAKKRYATLLSAYAPTLPSKEEVKDRFYRALDEALCRTPKEDKIFLLGDFNARVGKDNKVWSGVIGRHGIGQANANGLRLLSLCAEHDLTITNTIFQLKNKHKTSWMHPRSKHWHLIDYTIVRRSDIKDVTLTRAMRGAECWTDHRLIITRLRVQVRPAIRLQKSGKKRLDCTRLADPMARDNLRLSLAKNLEDIEHILESDDSIDDKWTSISSRLYEAASQSIGYKRRKHQDWFDDNTATITTMLKHMHTAHNAVLNNPTSAVLRQQWQTSRREVQSKLRALKNEWWISKAAEIQSHANKNDMHNFYDAMKTIYGPRNCSVSPLKSNDGTTLIKDQKLITKRWAEHFETLLNQPAPTDPSVLEDLPDYPTIHDLDLPPTFGEVKSAIRSLKDNKTPGPDSIPAEIFKQGGYLSIRALFLVISKVWKHETVPQQWRDANIITIYKGKGDKSLCGNSRGISLLAVAGKVLAKVMLHRLVNNITEDLLPESQCGFRKNRSTVDMVFTTRQLQEKCREQHQDLFVAFIDLSKAFDTVNRELLWNILLKFGCPQKFVNILRQFHEGMMSRVTIGGQESEPFKVCTGVRQGCVLAPVLFNIFLLCVTLLLHERIKKGSGVTVDFRLDGNLFNIRRLQAVTKVTPVQVIELQYADDCAVVAHTPEALQATLSAAASAYGRLGLSVNVAKTEVICQWASTPPPHPPTFTINNKPLAVVDSFKYLGSFLSDDCSIDREVQNRIKQASASFGRLRGRVFQNKDLKLHTKVAVYLAVVMTTLLYSCEAWTLYSRHLRMLEAFHIRCLQCILGVSWKDRVPHTEILCKTNYHPAPTITQHQLRWLGHVIRMPEERLPRKVLYGQLHLGHRLAGGPKKRYKDQMKTVMKKCGLNPTQLEDTAVQRSTWRQLLQQGVHKLEEDRSGQRARKRQRRSCGSRIGLFSHMRTHKT